MELQSEDRDDVFRKAFKKNENFEFLDIILQPTRLGLGGHRFSSHKNEDDQKAEQSDDIVDESNKKDENEIDEVDQNDDDEDDQDEKIDIEESAANNSESPTDKAADISGDTNDERDLVELDDSDVGHQVKNDTEESPVVN